MEIREATPGEDVILIDHYMKLWRSFDIPVDDISDEATDIVAQFLTDGRSTRSLRSYVAVIDDTVVGSVSFHIPPQLFPEIVRREKRFHGYIWSVWVDEAFRRQGIANALTHTALDCFRAMGCTTAVLHASEAGESIYRAIGFEPVKEMRMKLAMPPVEPKA